MSRDAGVIRGSNLAGIHKNLELALREERTPWMYTFETSLNCTFEKPVNQPLPSLTSASFLIRPVLPAAYWRSKYSHLYRKFIVIGSVLQTYAS